MNYWVTEGRWVVFSIFSLNVSKWPIERPTETYLIWLIDWFPLAVTEYMDERSDICVDEWASEGAKMYEGECWTECVEHE